MYRLLKDKNNEFQCEIMLEGASAKDASARLFLEADGCEYVFNGHIANGKCTIPMGKLKKFANLLESGKIRLEVVADDTLFVPYESDYELDQEKKVTVEVAQPAQTPKKPMVEVKVQEVPPKKTQPIKQSAESPKQIGLLEIKNYLKNHTEFDGSLKSFSKVIRNAKHGHFFNALCETFELNKAAVIKQLLK